jgi:hypothetical protein
MPMYNLPDVYSTTNTVPSTANLQVNDRRMKISTIKTSFCSIYYSLILAYSKRGF